METQTEGRWKIKANIRFHSLDAARSTPGKPVATILPRMPCVAAGELHEGTRLIMYPPIIVDVSLVASRYYEGLPKKERRQKIAATCHTHRDCAEAKI